MIFTATGSVKITIKFHKVIPRPCRGMANTIEEKSS